MSEDDRRRQMMAKSVVLLQKSATTFGKLSGPTCGACHHQLMTPITLGVVRDRGVSVDEKQAADQRTLLEKTLAWARPMMVKAAADPETDKQGDAGDTVFVAGYVMAGYAADKRAPDAATDIMVRYILREQRPDGRFAAYGTRAPLEGSDFTNTANVIRALQTYARGDNADAAAAVIARAWEWLAGATPNSNDFVIVIQLGMLSSNADEATIRKAADELLAQQYDDGGWSQLPGQLLSSDAYATGQALVALHDGGGLSVDEPAYQRGVTLLLAMQRPDGAWIVKKRATPIVPYFDAGFPGGKDQYISFTASCWATMALALTLPPKPAATPTTTGGLAEAGAPGAAR
jgi:hypothetical protein